MQVTCPLCKTALGDYDVATSAPLEHRLKLLCPNPNCRKQFSIIAYASALDEDRRPEALAVAVKVTVKDAEANAGKAKRSSQTVDVDALTDDEALALLQALQLRADRVVSRSAVANERLHAAAVALDTRRERNAVKEAERRIIERATLRESAKKAQAARDYLAHKPDRVAYRNTLLVMLDMAVGMGTVPKDRADTLRDVRTVDHLHRLADALGVPRI